MKNLQNLRQTVICRAGILKWIAISQFRFQKIKWHEFVCIVYKFGEIRSSNPKVYTAKYVNFCGDAAKIGISHQISQNILDWSLAESLSLSLENGFTIVQSVVERKGKE